MPAYITHVGHVSLHLIESIPATFWGIVVGSFFTLTGVALTNRASDKRLRIQFDHERKLKAAERELSIRKDIMLELIAGLEAGSISVGKLYDLNYSDVEIASEFANRLPSIAKARMVTSINTVKKIDVVVHEIHSAITESVIERDELREDYEFIKQGNLRLRGTITPFNHTITLQDIRARQYASLVRIMKLREMSNECQRKIHTALTDLLLAVRMDLGIETDSEGWLKHGAQLLDRNVQYFENERSIYWKIARRKGIRNPEDPHTVGDEPTLPF